MLSWLRHREMIALVMSHWSHCSFKGQKQWIRAGCIRIKLIKICLSLQGNQEAPAPPEAMAQPYAPAQYPPPPPQNGLPGEYTHPGQDYTGPSPVPEHAAALTIYTPTQTHSEPPGTDSSTPSLTGTSSLTVSAHCCKCCFVCLFLYCLSTDSLKLMYLMF